MKSQKRWTRISTIFQVIAIVNCQQKLSSNFASKILEPIYYENPHNKLRDMPLKFIARFLEFMTHRFTDGFDFFYLMNQPRNR